jgi:hypothetical protein
MSDTFLVGEAGYSSGFKIRPMRCLVGVDALRAHLESTLNFPSKTRSLSYSTRVYQVFPDKQPKKLNESKLLALLNVGDPRAKGNPKKAATPRASSLKRGRELIYSQLQELADGAVVWVRYLNPETGEAVINAPHSIRRSRTHSTAKLPAWYLTDLKDPAGAEVFIQEANSRNARAVCIDDDRMVLYQAVTKRLP